MTTFLYAHTGSGNHGCEALVRSTVKLIGEKPVLFSSGFEEDIRFGIDKITDLKQDIVTNISRKSLTYISAAMQTKLSGKTTLFTKYQHQTFLDEVNKGDICLSIGGDNYCYAGTEILGDLNTVLRSKGAKTVLWGCSIDPEAITPAMVSDLKKYNLITVREPLTRKALADSGVSSNVIMVADSAFLLTSQKTSLPENFVPGETIGINLSPLILNYTEQKESAIEAFRELVKHILSETDHTIALIPHVIKQGNSDLEVLKLLYEEFCDSGRIMLIDDHNCMELKYIISQCSMFIGARTHATIAAYSSYVPTLVIGYSVKSRGIACDLFGTDENYVLPVQSIRSGADLVSAYQWLDRNSQQIKERLGNVIPSYQEKAKKAQLFFEELKK